MDTQGSQWIPKVTKGYHKFLTLTQGYPRLPCGSMTLHSPFPSPTIQVPNPSPQSQSPVPVPSPSPQSQSQLLDNFETLLVHFYESTPSWLKVIGGVAYVILESAQVFVFWP